MAKASRVFGEMSSSSAIPSLGSSSSDQGDVPWQAVKEGQFPPMMFQLRFRDGARESFPYGDIRRIRCSDAGMIQLETFSSPRTLITIEGRYLHELGVLLTNALIRWVAENDPRDTDRSESSPTINRIQVQLVADR
ncbi:MAG: hypothetical protein AAFX06_08690 [Planctomycetota bacterium]